MLKNKLYVQNATKITSQIKKVFNADAYFFTFPLSLRREALFGGYNYYRLKSFYETKYKEDREFKVGILFDTYLMNLLSLPITLEYRYNTNENITYSHNFSINAEFRF